MLSFLLFEIRAKQYKRGLVIDSSQSGLIVKYGKVTIPCKYKAKDLWLQDEEKAILAYLAEPELQDAHAVDQMSKGIIRIPTDRVLLFLQLLYVHRREAVRESFYRRGKQNTVCRYP